MRLFKGKTTKNKFVEDPGKPIFLGIESYNGITKKQLEKYLYGIAEKNFSSMRGCHYQIVKFEKGYVAEIHDGGNGYGVLQSVLRHLEEHNEVIIETSSNRKIKVSKKTTNVGTTFKSYALNEDDNTAPTDEIAFVDQLKPFITSGYGLWRLSIGLAFAGILALATGAIFKHIVYDRTTDTQFIGSGKDVPLKQLNELLIAKPREGNYISAIKYKNGTWSREEKKLTVPALPKPESTPELNKLNEIIEAPNPGHIDNANHH